MNGSTPLLYGKMFKKKKGKKKKAVQKTKLCYNKNAQINWNLSMQLLGEK